jgi:uncharacterized membrane protein YkoI
MKKSIKLLGATALLATIIPISAYAATQTSNSPAPVAAITTQAPDAEVADAAEAPGTEVADATEAPGTEVADATEAPGTEVADATEAPGTEVADATEAAKAPEVVDPNEQANLQKAAKITQQQASDAALKQVSGTVKKVELEDENGVVVYGVQIVDASGKSFDVKVDAATGTAAKAQSDDNNEN